MTCSGRYNFFKNAKQNTSDGVILSVEKFGPGLISYFFAKKLMY